LILSRQLVIREFNIALNPYDVLAEKKQRHISTKRQSWPEKPRRARGHRGI